jgi:hypothetical protein
MGLGSRSNRVHRSLLARVLETCHQVLVQGDPTMLWDSRLHMRKVLLKFMLRPLAEHIAQSKNNTPMGETSFQEMHHVIKILYRATDREHSAPL